MDTARNLRYCAWLSVFFFVSAVTWLGLVRIQVGVPTDTSKAFDAVRRYKADVASELGSPKLVLVGASGTYYSIRAETIDRELGVPTVNLGLTAGLGSRYILENAKRSLAKGDTALVALEYVLLFPGSECAPYALDLIYSRDPAYIATLPVGQRLALPLQLSPYRVAYGLLNRVRPLNLSRSDPLRLTEKLGDGLYEKEKPTQANRAMVGQQFEFPADGPNAEKLQDLARFAAWCKATGVRLVLSYPAIARMPDLDSPAGKAFLSKLQAFYKSTGAIVQGKPEDFIYDRSRFQDSRFHMTPKASEEHTLERVRLFRGLFKAPPDPASRTAGGGRLGV